jgi:hypothetical protein
MKKPQLLTFGFLIFVFTLSAQSIERQLIGVAGENDSGSKILLDWTLGEPFTAYDNTLLGDYKEGFLQPDYLQQESSEKNAEVNNDFTDDFSVEVFPNPFNETFTLQINKTQDLDTQLTILDYSGKILMKKILPAGSLKMEWTMNDYPTGLYFLQLADDPGNLRQTFKLLKM